MTGPDGSPALGPVGAEPGPVEEILEQRRQLVSELVMRLMLLRRAPVTFLLLAILCGVFGLSVLLGGSDDPAVLATLGAKVNALVAGGEWWRLVSSVFVHVGWIHLAVNGYALFVLGRLVENALGRRRFLVLFVLSGVAGSLASFVASPPASAGASGAIFGLLGAALASGWKYRRNIPPRLLRHLALALVPWLVIALGYGLTSTTVDNAAHIGGLAAGLAFGGLASSPLLSHGQAHTATVPLNLTFGVVLGLLLYGALGSLASLLHAAG